ncbi:hypothetical protein GBA52_024121 [Prunus armeniaca]|nr:hypothetical protein GBA52_024121 [Prunus armeniaca]
MIKLRRKCGQSNDSKMEYVQPDWDLIEDPGWDLIEEVRPRPILTHSAPARRRSLKEEILDRLLSIWKKTLKISKEFLGPLLPIWNKIFVISCVFAVLMDPLFFYTPVINEDMKCLELDKNLKKIALALRSVTDLFYLVDIIFQIYQLNVTSKISINGATFRLERVKSAKKILLSCIVIDTFAVLPVPQLKQKSWEIAEQCKTNHRDLLYLETGKRCPIDSSPLTISNQKTIRTLQILLNAPNFV